jgi:multiple sugar transport system ATP-binding protein
MAEVVMEHLSKRYPDGLEAVSDVTIDVQDGEFLILVGPSGSGKSTALKMIAGLEDITDGEVRIGDRVVNGLSPKERDIAMVFQDYALYPHMTVRENLAFPLKLAKVPDDQVTQKVQEAAGILDLTEHLDRKPANLSGGQRQRVAMGRAIVRDPKAFLMDEPLSNLDAKLRVQMRAVVARIQQRLETTTVYVTHDQTEAMTLGDRVAVLRGGRLQQVGRPTELYDDPVNIFVAGFIGSPAMNFMPGELGEGVATTPLGDIPLHEEARARAGSHRGSVIVGIRPESFQTAALVSDDVRERGVTFKATIDLVQSLGAEEYVYFELEGTHVESEELGELAADSGATDIPSSGEGQVVARLDPESRVRRGEEAELWVDATKLYFFHPEEGGRNLAE